MPFVGVLVRYRANYTPKAGAVRLDDEPGLPGNLTSDASLSYFGMMQRVYRIEGWGGLYKGLSGYFFKPVCEPTWTVTYLGSSV
jgi:endo-1,4-beta-mannosidase